MHPLPPLPPWRRLPLLALGLLAAHSPLAAQADAPVQVVSTGFPDPLWLALLVIAACGAIGAFAADLVTDGGRIEQWRRDEAGWSLGFVAKMIIGLVAAIIFLTLNPPGEAWVALVGTALAAGLGGEAILLAIIASRRAQAAESERTHAQAETARTLGAWEENIRTFESVALAAARTSPARANATAGVTSEEAWSDAPPPPSPLAVVSAYADHAVAEVRRRATLVLP
jgi:carbon starvation protein CstA